MLTPEQHERLFGWRHAIDHPVTRILTLLVAAILLLCPVIIVLLSRAGRITPAHRQELFRRYRSWLVLAPLMLVPVLAGAFWTIAAVCVLSLLCYREFARATGLFREKLMSLVVVVGILLVTFATLDHWYGLFVALPPLVISTIAVCAIFQDRPRGYIQRVGLAVLAFMLLGVCLGHLAYFANDSGYRAILFLIVFSVELNDVFAYIVGRSLGSRKLAPNTSPNKTVAGSIGALILTTLLVMLLSHFVFRNTVLARPRHGLALGLIISALGQLGDLLLSSVKRDVGVKDMGTVFPGHGGLLDRFDSLILVAPAVFHYVGYFIGIGLSEPHRLFTGS